MRLAIVARITIWISGVLLIGLGLLFWTGNADQLIPVHEFLGFVLVIALWTLAFLAARAGVSIGLVALAVVWGLVAPFNGLGQSELLAGGWHWVIQVTSVQRMLDDPSLDVVPRPAIDEVAVELGSGADSGEGLPSQG